MYLKNQDQLGSILEMQSLFNSLKSMKNELMKNHTIISIQEKYVTKLNINPLKKKPLKNIKRE